MINKPPCCPPCYLTTDGTVTSVNLANVLNSTPDFQKLRLTTTSFPLFKITFKNFNGKPADFSGTDLYVATTYNLQGDSDLPVYQIPKKITSP